MAIQVGNENNVAEIDDAVQAYMLGELTLGEAREFCAVLQNKLKIVFGQWLVFRYAVVDAQNQTIAEREKALRCPQCGKPSVYFLLDFGPACSGENGGCGLKAPEEKRPWYAPPYTHEDEAKAPTSKK